MRTTPLIAGLALCAALAAPIQGKELVLNADQLRVAASEALRAEDPVRAVAFADALLKRDSTDLTAHLIRAKGLRSMSRFSDAQRAARTAWSLADTDEERYASALVMAQALSSDGKRTRAQLWLRRAGEHAPNDALRNRAKRDFRYVKQRNPWQTTLSFTLAPNSNVNNGSTRESTISERLEINGLPVEFVHGGTALALSGLEYGATIDSRYRVAQTATTAHDLSFGASYTTVALSSSAKRTAPSARGSDFAFGTLSLGYDYRRLNFDRRGELQIGGDITQSWYGGAQYATVYRVSADQSYSISRTHRLRFGLEGQIQDGQETADLNRVRVSASLLGQAAQANQYLLAATLEKVTSESAALEYSGIELRAAYIFSQKHLGAQWQIGSSLRYRDHDYSPYTLSGRQDTRVSADLTGTFTDIDYYGFNPTVTFSASKTSSNVNRYDVNRFGVSFGIRSSF